MADQPKDPRPVLLIGADTRLLGWLGELFGQRVKCVPSWMEAIAEVSANKYQLVLGSIEDTAAQTASAVAALRSSGQEVKIILCCRPTLEPLARQALAAGADEYLIEPIARQEFIEALNGQLTRSQTLQATTAGVAEPPKPQTLALLAQAAPPPPQIIPISDPLDFCAQLLQAAQFGLDELMARAQRLLADRLQSKWAKLELFEQQPSAAPVDTCLERTVGLSHGGSLSVRLGPTEPTAIAPQDLGQGLEQLLTLLGPLADATREKAALQKLAITDELTGLYNRRYVYEFTEQVLARARIERFEVTVLLFDVDDFKRYNDTFGHATGDEVLKETADLMRRCSREHDLVGRFGGDEFCMIFWDAEKHRQPGSRHPQDAFALSNRFRRTVSAHDYKCLGPHAKGILTISGGLASFPWNASTVDGLFAQADDALLKAKQSGKNRIYIVGREESR